MSLGRRLCKFCQAGRVVRHTDDVSHIPTLYVSSSAMRELPARKHDRSARRRTGRPTVAIEVGSLADVLARDDSLDPAAYDTRRRESGPPRSLRPFAAGHTLRFVHRMGTGAMQTHRIASRMGGYVNSHRVWF